MRPDSIRNAYQTPPPLILPARTGGNSHFGGEISRHFEASADFFDDWGCPAHEYLLIHFPV